MFIKRVVSFRGAWTSLVDFHSNELAQIESAVEELSVNNIMKTLIRHPLISSDRQSISPMKVLACWDNSIKSRGWLESRDSIENMGGRPIRLRGLGHIHNKVSASLIRSKDSLNRWLYTIAPIATRNGYIDIPIAIVMLSESEHTLYNRRSPGTSADLEGTINELIALSPLSHDNPFLILGVSFDEGQLETTEILAESDIKARQVVINRSIEFPPEYHQAGLGILNYFSSILHEKYPEHKAKVKIEQDGLKVRLIIESENGDREIIEKALQEYELVVRGDLPPESIFNSKSKILELKNELRIAQVRIESQRDIIEFQGSELKTLKQIFVDSNLRGGSGIINISVSPIINLTNSNSLEFNIASSISEISSDIQDFTELAKLEPSMQLKLMDLDEAINNIENKKDVESIRSASGLKKLKRFLEEANEIGSSTKKFVDRVSNGIVFIQRLAKKYNEIAEWCGAPQVPSFFLERNS